MKYLLHDFKPHPNAFLRTSDLGSDFTGDDAISVSIDEVLERCDAAGFRYVDMSDEVPGRYVTRAYYIFVPDDRDAAFAFRMFVQP